MCMTYAPKVIIRLVIATALALTGLVAVSTATPAQAAVSATYLNGYERQVVDAINAERPGVACGSWRTRRARTATGSGGRCGFGRPTCSTTSR